MEELLCPKLYLVTKAFSIYLGILTDKMLQFVEATVFLPVSETVREVLISKYGRGESTVAGVVYLGILEGFLIKFLEEYLPNDMLFQQENPSTCTFSHCSSNEPSCLCSVHGNRRATRGLSFGHLTSLTSVPSFLLLGIQKG
jgi:hypothetical protein